MEYDRIFKINKLDQQMIEYFNEYTKNKTTESILISIKNTKELSSDMLKTLTSSTNVSVRIAGGYDTERVQRNSKEDYYKKAVVYSRNEVIKMIAEMEKVEKGIDKKWPEIQKAVYIYDKLKTNIMYDPAYEKKDSHDIRTLRGLMTKKTVCAGYAMIFKEMLDRQGIENDYVEGGKKGKPHSHAWNLVKINGEIFPVDLTWDSTIHRRGNFKSNHFFANIDEFITTHIPDLGEKVQNYNVSLKGLDSQFVKKISDQNNSDMEYNTTTYRGTRKDNGKCVISQVGNSTINGKECYRYLYADKLPNNKFGKPILLYSETNLADFIEKKNFNKNVSQEYEKAIEVLFSVENINDSIEKQTLYIGKTKKDNQNKGVDEFVSKAEDIIKSDENIERFKYPIKQYKRNDGSTFVMQKMIKNPKEIADVNVMKYDCFELINENGKLIVKRNVLWTEKNLFKDDRPEIANVFLSRDRLNKKVREVGGYLGNIDNKGLRINNPKLTAAFEMNKNIDISPYDVLSAKKR